MSMSLDDFYVSAHSCRFHIWKMLILLIYGDNERGIPLRFVSVRHGELSLRYVDIQTVQF